MRTAIFALLLAWVGLACATEQTSVGMGTELLAQGSNRTQLVDQIGKQPRACMHSLPGYEICAWTLRARVDSRWAEFAKAVGTQRAVGVICELPTANGSRGPDSCRVHARVARSYTDAFRASGSHDVASPSTGSSRSRQAQHALDAAVTLRELSFLVGDVPGECLRRSNTKQLCTWRLTSRMAGHRLVAATIGETRKVTLACFLAYDGTHRRPEDCAVALSE